jgi:glycine/D-amino acid oxidase-like deaminating enzyme
VLSAAALGAYRRITPDGRLILGGGPVAVTAGRGPARLLEAARTAWRWQRAWLTSTHPGLAAVGIDHRWRGRVSMTRDGLPALARIPGPAEIWYAGGWNGHGLAATVEAGAELAARVLSDAGQTGDHAFGIGQPWLLTRAAARPLVRAYLAAGVPKLGPRPREGKSSAAAYT